MKKLLALVLTLALAFTLVACGNENTDDLAAWEQELGTAGVIRIGMSPDYEPFESYDADGNIVGFDVEMANEIAKHLGVEGTPYKIEIIPLDFQTIISAMNAGQVDIGISCFTEDPAREVLFTTPYLESSQVVVVSKEGGITKLEDLVGKTVAAGMNTTGEAVANQIAEEYGEMNVIGPGSGYPFMFESLKSGAYGAVVCDKAVGQSFIDNDPDAFMLLPDTFEVENTCIIVKKGNDELYKAINGAVEKFNESDEKVAMLEEYDL